MAKHKKLQNEEQTQPGGVSAGSSDIEERYLALFNAIEQGFCIIELLFDSDEKALDYRFIEVSPSFERQSGISNALGRWMREIAPSHDEHWYETYGRVALTGEPVRFENYSTPLGRWWSVYAFRIQDPHLRRVGVLFYDITAARQRDEAIRDSEARYRTFLDLSSEGVWRFELESPIPTSKPLWEQIDAMLRDAYLAECNRAMAGMYGYETVEEMVGLRVTDFLPADSPETWDFLEAFVRSGYRLERFESYETDRSGSPLIFENTLMGYLEPDPGGRASLVRVWGTQRDVTARRSAERALQESEERYRSLFESIDEGFCVLEIIRDAYGRPVNHRFVQTNPAFERLTGFVNASGRLVREFVPDADPSWTDTFAQVEETGKPVRFTREVARMARWFSVYAFPTGAPGAAQVGVLLTDVTEQKVAEQDILAASALKDEFLSLVSHELRTPLTVLRGDASLLERYPDLPHDTRREIFHDLRIESERLHRLVENMLLLGRLQAGQPPLTEPVLVDRVVRQAVDRFLDQQAVDRVHIGPLPEQIIALGVHGYIDQVLNNFLSNAYKYSPPDTRVLVTARCFDDFVKISVADRGRGLPHPGSLFVPFYRDPETSPLTPGLGLGLAVSRRLVEAMGGEISARPRRGGGSVFSFTLRLYPEQA
jgi:PAS domain S-box-containing protein